ncbi:MAG: JDVT-CTERM system glutamic-type intramembrane protease, partial [Pseudomonadota bacterium]
LSFGGNSLVGFSLANVLTSLLFATLHLFTHAPLWALSVIAPSLVFGWFWDRYRSILPGTLLHCSYNLSYFLVFGLPPVSLGV